MHSNTLHEKDAYPYIKTTHTNQLHVLIPIEIIKTTDQAVDFSLRKTFFVGNKNIRQILGQLIDALKADIELAKLKNELRVKKEFQLRQAEHISKLLDEMAVYAPTFAKQYGHPEVVQDSFNQIWGVLKDYIFVNKPEDIYQQENEKWMRLSTFVNLYNLKLYDKYFGENAEFKFDIPANKSLFSSTTQIAHLNPANIRMDYSKLSLNVVSKIIMEHFKQNTQASLSDMKKELEGRPDWPWVVHRVLKSVPYEDFSRALGAVTGYLIDLQDIEYIEKIYGYLLDEDADKFHEKIGALLGVEKLTSALDLLFEPLKLESEEYDTNSLTLYTPPESIGQFSNIVNLLCNIRHFDFRFYITPTMFAHYVQLAKSKNFVWNNFSKLADLKEEVSIAKMLQDVSNDYLGISTAVTADIKVSSLGQGKGYLVGGNPSLLKNLCEIYYHSLSIDMNESQLIDLLIEAKFIEFSLLEISKIAQVLKMLGIAFYSVIAKNDTVTIVTGSKEHKNILERICKISTLTANQSIRNNVSTLVKSFSMKPVMLVYAKTNFFGEREKPITRLRFELDFTDIPQRELANLLQKMPTGKSKLRQDTLPYNFSCDSSVVENKENVEHLIKKVKLMSQRYRSYLYNKSVRPRPDYQVLLSSGTLLLANSYLESLQPGAKNCKVQGAYLSDILKKQKLSPDQLSVEKLIDLLCATIHPHTNFLLDIPLGWNETEVQILEGLILSARVDIYDNGAIKDPVVYSQPIWGNIVYMPLVALTNEHSALIKAEVSLEGLYHLYEERLLLILAHINKVEEGKQNNIGSPYKTPNPSKALLTVGAADFAQFSAKMGDYMQPILREVLKRHAEKFPHIAALVYVFDNDSPDSDINYGHIRFLSRSSVKKINKDKLQLCLPSQYEKTPNEFSNCNLWTLASRHAFTYIGEEMLLGRRETASGAKAAATNILSVMTGEEGVYNYAENIYAPKHEAVNWLKSILQNGCALGAQSIQVSYHGWPVVTVSERLLSASYFRFPMTLFKKMLSDSSADVLKEKWDLNNEGHLFDFLTRAHWVVWDIVKCEGGFDLLIDKRCSPPLREAWVEFVLTRATALLIYRNIFPHADSSNEAYDRLVLGDILQMTQTDWNSVANYLQLDAQGGVNGQSFRISARRYMDHVNNDLDPIKRSIILELTKFSEVRVHDRITAVIGAIKGALQIDQVIDLLENQKALASSKVQSENLPADIDEKWTRQIKDVPFFLLNSYKERLSYLIDNVCYSKEQALEMRTIVIDY